MQSTIARIAGHALLIGAIAVLCGFAAHFAPPSGRPPIGPLERDDPRIYDFTFEVTVGTTQQINAEHRRTFTLADTPIVFPVIFNSTWSEIEQDSLRSRLWLAATEDTTLASRNRLDQNIPFHAHLAVITIPEFVGQSLRWQVSYRAKLWSSRITSESDAAALTWPTDFPAEVQDGLKPQLFIESDSAIFKQTVDRISDGKLRDVPPYLAAKDIVRYCTEQIQVRGSGVHRGQFRELQGMTVKGALQAVRDGHGSEHDLTCVCIAMLRAAGIPARIVIGAEDRGDKLNRFKSWGEFYLEGAGWIPFDPDEMRTKGIRNKNVRDPWPYFGTIKELNELMPLAYQFLPSVGVEAPMHPAVWGWDPRPGEAPTAEQAITLTFVSRGPAREPEEVR